MPAVQPRSAPSITMIYAAIGVAWILAGTIVAQALFGPSLATWQAFEVGKGLAYVVVTSGALMWLLAREFRRREALEKERVAALDQVTRTLVQAVEALAETVGKRDPYTAGHQARVAQISIGIARRLGLPEGQIEGIRLGALMHDIGKIAVPAELLTKPGKLSPQEFELIKQHTVIGEDIVRNIDFVHPVVRIVAEHHERMDGSGYPRGLKGDEILLEARIVAVADMVEAVSAHRPYRPALGLDAAVEELRRCRGSGYDPVVVDACLDLMRQPDFEI